MKVVNKVLYKRTPESVWKEFWLKNNGGLVHIVVCDGIIVTGKHYCYNDFHHILDEKDGKSYNCNWDLVAKYLEIFYNRDREQFNQIMALLDKNTDEYEELKSAVENYAKTEKWKHEKWAKKQIEQVENFSYAV